MSFARTRSEGCLSDLALDRLAAGELNAAAAATAEEHLAGCTGCAARRQQLDQDRAVFRAAPPVLRRPRPRRNYQVAVGMFLASAAALVLFVARRPEPSTRRKGGERLGFYVKRGDTVWRGGPAELVQPGDALRFEASGTDSRWVAILSLDGARHASIYFPDGPMATRMPPGPLPLATVLDEQLGTEQLFGLFCAQAEALEPLRQTLEQTGALVPPLGCELDVLTIEKRAR